MGNLDYNKDTGVFTRISTGRIAGTDTDNGYRKIGINNKRVYAHRLAWLMHYGYEPKGEIDHINRDRSDNRIANLRDVSASINQRNRSDWTVNTGIRFRKDKQRWQAYIHVNNKFKSLGHFSCETAAKMARRVKEKELGYE